MRRSGGTCPHGVDVIGNGHAAIAVGIHVVHDTDKPSLRLINLQRRPPVNGDFLISIGGVGHVASILNGPLKATAQPFVDDFIFPAGHKGLEFRQLIINLVRQVIDLFGGDD